MSATVKHKRDIIGHWLGPRWGLSLKRCIAIFVHRIFVCTVQYKTGSCKDMYIVHCISSRLGSALLLYASIWFPHTVGDSCYYNTITIKPCKLSAGVSGESKSL